MTDHKKIQLISKLNLGFVVLAAVIGAFLAFYLSNIYYVPNIVYSEGEYYTDPTGFTTQLEIKNVGYMTAKNIVINITFNSHILGIQKPDDVERDRQSVISQNNPPLSAILRITRMVKGAKRVIFITVKEKQEKKYVEFLEHEEGSGQIESEGFSWGTIFISVIIGIVLGALLDRGLSEKQIRKIVKEEIANLKTIKM